MDGVSNAHLRSQLVPTFADAYQDHNKLRLTQVWFDLIDCLKANFTSLACHPDPPTLKFIFLTRRFSIVLTNINLVVLHTDGVMDVLLDRLNLNLTKIESIAHQKNAHGHCDCSPEHHASQISTPAHQSSSWVGVYGVQALLRVNDFGDKGDQTECSNADKTNHLEAKSFASKT